MTLYTPARSAGPSMRPEAAGRLSVMICCTRCGETKARPAFPDGAPTDRCTHSPDVCSDCFTQYIHNQRRIYPSITPFCPARECDLVDMINCKRRCDAGSDKTPPYSGPLTAGVVPLSVATVGAADETRSEASLRTPTETGPSRTCQICLEDLPPQRFSRYKPTGGCTHEPMICRRCLRKYLKTRIRGSGDVAPTCPTPGCDKPFEYNDVKKGGRSKTFQRYDELLLRKQLGSQPGFVWCKHPLCSSGQIYEPVGASTIVYCKDCGTKSCFKHDTLWHEGMTCQQYDSLLAQKSDREETLKSYMLKYTKKCPMCQAPIEKISGCDHMTCRPPGGCGHQFCWECLADYDPILRDGNHRHEPDCQFHPRGIAERAEAVAFAARMATRRGRRNEHNRCCVHQ